MKQKTQEFYRDKFHEFMACELPGVEFCKEHDISYSGFRAAAQRFGFSIRLRRWIRTDVTPYRKSRRSHRGYEWMRVPVLQCKPTCIWCDECPYRTEGQGKPCIPLESYVDKIYDYVIDKSGGDESYSFIAARLAKLSGFLVLLEWDLYRNGLIRKDAQGNVKYAPILSTSYVSVSNSVTRLCKECGLTPLSAKNLGIDRNAYRELLDEIAGIAKDE